MSRGKYTYTREDGVIVTHCGGTYVKNTHSKDYFFTKGEFCGVCKKSKKANRQNIIICTGKSLSEALIFASINPQYDSRLFMELP